jgi:hypothetical protein
VVRSPVLATDGIAWGKCGGVTECAVDQRTIRAVEVQLLPPKHHLFSLGEEIGEAEEA